MDQKWPIPILPTGDQQHSRETQGAWGLQTVAINQAKSPVLQEATMLHRLTGPRPVTTRPIAQRLQLSFS